MNSLAQLGATRRLSFRIALACTALFACDASDSDADAGSDAGAVPDAAQPEPDAAQPDGFHARLEGDVVMIDWDGGALSTLTCSGVSLLEKREGDRWVPLRDDRPPSWNSPGYFIDGEYSEPSFNLGCDVVSCYEPNTPLHMGFAREYVKTGTQPIPDGAGDAGIAAPILPADPADVIETRAFHGLLRARFTYSLGTECAEQLEAIVELEVPEEGVCCPIGNAGCSSEGPGGGWAPTLDACRPWSIEYDALSVRATDVRDCPVLVQDYDMCCGCAIEDGNAQDAGI